MVGWGHFKMQAASGGGGGLKPTISLVQGKVAPLAATLEPNLWGIHSGTGKRVGSSPPSAFDPPPLSPWQPQGSPQDAFPRPPLAERCRPSFASPHPAPCPYTPISLPTPQMPFALPLAGASPPKPFRLLLSPAKHPQAPDNDPTWHGTSELPTPVAHFCPVLYPKRAV